MVLLQVGIDPAKKSCVASVVDDSGHLCRKRLDFVPNRSGVARLVERVQALGPGVPCHFFVEASGYLWYAPAALLRELGQPVSLINPSYTKAQRRLHSPHAKSDARDAQALARVAFNMGDKALHPADIPEGARLNLRLLVRQRARTQEQATAIKLRLLSWLGLTAPGLTELWGTELSASRREFLGHFPTLAKLRRLGPERVRRFLERRAPGESQQETVQALFALVQEAYCPRDLDDRLVAEQFAMEFEHLALLAKHLQQLDRRIGALLAQCDPQGLARSLPGFGPLVAGILVAEAGCDLSRFPSAKHFASWTGVVSRASGTAGQQVEGLPITKAGRGIVKWALYMAARSAVNHDPEMHALYDRLRAKEKHHNVALLAVAHQLARVYWAVMTEQRPYQKRPPRTP